MRFAQRQLQEIFCIAHVRTTIRYRVGLSLYNSNQQKANNLRQPDK